MVVDGAEDEGGVGSAVRAGGERARPGGGLRSCAPGSPTAWCKIPQLVRGCQAWATLKSHR